MRHMRKKIIAGSTHPLVLALRNSLVRSLPPHDKTAEARAIYDFAAKAIRYTDDPPGHDTIQSAQWVIGEHLEGRKASADCATQSVLVGALARSLDIPVRLVTIGDRKPTRGFFHVYPELWIDGYWTPADVTAATAADDRTRAAARLGYAHPATLRKIYKVR